MPTLRFSAAHGMSLLTNGVWDPRGAAHPTGTISAATTAAAEIHVAAAALSIVAAAVELPSIYGLYEQTDLDDEKISLYGPPRLQ